MPEGSLVRLAGSERGSLPDITDTASVDTSERAEVTLVLRRRAELPKEIVVGPTVLSRDELAERYGADPADVDLVRRELGGRGLEVTATDPGSRRVKVAGTLGDLSSAFGTTLRQVSSPDARGQGRVTHRYREGPLYVPTALDGIVTAVLGLDTRPQARPHFRTGGAGPAAAQGISYLPNQVADIYYFPAGTSGAGQTVAVIELGGGFTTGDLDTYFGSLGIAVPSITAVSVDGASNNPGDTSGASVQVNLDIDVIGAAAPSAAQVVYFAPNNGDQGLVDAICDAAHATPAPIAISISWGQSEDSWTGQGLSAVDAAIADAVALGITVCVAAGNNGSGDGANDGQPHVDFPASSPHALACGGTTLLADPSTGAVSSEVVWNEGAGGGGVSDRFPLPAWQANAGVPARAGGNAAVGRGVPDVAGNADPATGYQIYSGGQAQAVGGTGAVAPLWSALIARLAQATGKRFGLLQPLLYAAPIGGDPGVSDITSGNNGAYSAGPGWDACTGLGVPNGAALLTRLEPSGGAVWGYGPPGPPFEPRPPRPDFSYESDFEDEPAHEPPLWFRPDFGDDAELRRAAAEARREAVPGREAVNLQGVVHSAFTELVRPGRLLFNPPDRMKLGQTARVEVRLTRTLERDGELLEHLSGPGEPQVEEIPTAPLMAVTLKGDGFRVTAYSDEEQRVTPDEITTWEFDVQALKRGQQRLVMSVSLRIPVPGQPLEHKSIPRTRGHDQRPCWGTRPCRPLRGCQLAMVYRYRDRDRCRGGGGGVPLISVRGRYRPDGTHVELICTVANPPGVRLPHRTDQERPVPRRRPTWWSCTRPRNWPHVLRRTADGLSQDNWPTDRSAA